MCPTRKVWLLNVENLRTPDPGVLRKDEALSGIVSCSQAIGSNFQFYSGSPKYLVKPSMHFKEKRSLLFTGRWMQLAFWKLGNLILIKTLSPLQHGALVLLNLPYSNSNKSSSIFDKKWMAHGNTLFSDKAYLIFNLKPPL